jgi:hypothetical protein
MRFAFLRSGFAGTGSGYTATIELFVAQLAYW